MSQSGTAEPCPLCRKTAERVFTAPGIAVKGSPVKTPCDSGGAGGEECAGGCCDGHCALN
jgi:hypothetical protein